MPTRTLLLPLGGGVIGQDDVPLVRIMDSDETPTTITVYGVVDTVRPVESVTWTVNGVSQAGDVSKSPVLELTNLQPETSYAITLRATNMNGESQASTKTIWTKKVTTITPSDVLNGITYYDYQDVFQTGTIPSKDETDIVVSGRDVTVPAGYYDENETVSVSSDYIIPTGIINITDNGSEDVTQYAEVLVNVQPALEHLNVTPSTSQQTFTPTGADGYDQVVVGPVGASIDQNITSGNIKKDVVILGVTGDYDPTPNLDSLSVNPSTSAQLIMPTGGVDGFSMVSVNPVTSAIDQNITAGNIKKDVTILGVTGTFEGGITPTGTLNIVNNGTYDITNYANVNVNVAAGDFNEICFTANEANCKVGMTNNGNNAPVIYYSTDNKTTWTLWDYSEITLTNIGDKVYFYGYNPNGFSFSDGVYSNFDYIGSVNVSGNIMTLITRYGDRENIPSNYCFYRLFYHSPYAQAGSIYDASGFVLPSLNLTEHCYQYLFERAGLTISPLSLPALNIPANAYNYMFYNCGDLRTTPSFTAESLSNSSLNGMFQYCNNITTVDITIKAKTAGMYTFANMFQNCYHLTNTPIIETENIDQYTFDGMFNGCSSLTKSPILLPESFPNYAYRNMFKGNSNLTEIYTFAKTWNSNAATNWVDGVAQTGVFVKKSSLVIGTGSGEIPSDSPNGIPTGWTIINLPEIIDDNTYVSFSTPTGFSVYYTTDGTTPTTSSTQYTTPINAAAIGNKVTIKYIFTDGNNFISLPIDYVYYNMFNLEALEDNTVISIYNSGSKSNTQYSLNKIDWTSLKNVNSITLPNTGDKVYLRKTNANSNSWDQDRIGNASSGTVKASGFLEYAVFKDITGNVQDNSGCGNIFQGFTGLVDASDLVIFGNSYRNGFNGCTDLVYPPKIFPATTLQTYSYESCFSGCSSLIKMPILPATYVQDYGYNNMFLNCSSLKEASLPNVSGPTYRSPFGNMFKGCSSLCRVEVMIEYWNTLMFGDWLANVASHGTFIKPTALVVGTGGGKIPTNATNGIPTGWAYADKSQTPVLNYREVSTDDYVFALQGEWPNGTIYPCDIYVYDSNDNQKSSYIEIKVVNGQLDYDDTQWDRTYGTIYVQSSYTYDNERQMFIEIEMETGYYTQIANYNPTPPTP